MEEAAARKARTPIVESMTDGMIRRLVAAERRNVGDACERSHVSRRTTVKNSVTQHSNLVMYALRYPQPMTADKRISDVIGALNEASQTHASVAYGSHMNSRGTFEICVEKFADLVHRDVAAKPSLEVHCPIVYDIID